ncbi:carboxypeptidase-like regulatory domain-containing protein [Hymenobacter crusticola]|uniref:Carboxypeptidase regulatory-like domain-containing protein n=1 Tax=Hymenobacter crusticola TaxID=1770526 RepID=A0A243W5S2_9BACT|nr:carboxypeptidase-like regulatory domain-containing protein [Hymenobacter crusticola]OUJ68980.1 hypothetical protein BXP70_27125 [Hymenobacter crusticola]
MKVGRATILAAVFATAGGIWVSYYNAKEQRELEREQFQSNLIQQSIDFKDYKQSRANLQFLIDVGLIAEENSKINAFIRDTSVHLQRPIDRLPIAPPSHSKPYKIGLFSEAYLTGTIVDALTKRPVVGAVVIVEAYHRRYLGRPEPPPPEAEKMVTARDGKYQVHKPWGEYFLHIQRPGYKSVKLSSISLTDLTGIPDGQIIEIERE